METIEYILKVIVVIMAIIQVGITTWFVSSPSKFGTVLTRTYPFIFAIIAVFAVLA